jgi:16S rRNA (guanine1207-N2)-methyltransferase
VRSAARNLGDDPRARVVHADLTAGEVGEGFDAVWCNPPFHVGRQVVGALSRAFVAAAHEALRPGGEAWFVANRALPYEAELGGWAAWGDATPAAERTFKVLWARRSG